MDASLKGQLLVASPAMGDPRFAQTVILMVQHDREGAFGLVINRPTDMTIDDLFQRIDLKLEIVPSNPDASSAVLFGGPVQDDRGFVLHTPRGEYSSTLKITDDISFTTSRDVLEAVANGSGPQQILISIGYSGWGAGQLEEEIAHNGWLTVAADRSIMFDLPIAERYAAAIKLLGIDPMMLTGEAGHA